MDALTGEAKMMMRVGGGNPLCTLLCPDSKNGHPPPLAGIGFRQRRGQLRTMLWPTQDANATSHFETGLLRPR